MSPRQFHLPAPVATFSATAARTAARLTLALTLLLAAPSCATTPRDMRFADVEGQRISYRVLGSGRPTIVMISGLGDGMATFQDVAPELATTATVILYDRAGYGGSDATTGPRDAEAAERELSAVLDQSGASGPYVLVGHSLGGLYAEYFAAQHPDQILGVVLEESRPADFTQRCESAGISSCTLPASLAWTLPEGGRAELASLPMTVSAVERLRAAHGRPVLVLSRPLPANPSAFDVLWSTAQRDLAARYPGARQLVAEGGGHYIHRDQRAWFVESVGTFVSNDLARR